MKEIEVFYMMMEEEIVNGYNEGLEVLKKDFCEVCWEMIEIILDVDVEIEF